MKLTTRGEIVFIIALVALAILAYQGISAVATSLWWVDTGWCWGSVQECYGVNP
jgi:hypothetical protein